MKLRWAWAGLAAAMIVAACAAKTTDDDSAPPGSDATDGGGSDASPVRDGGPAPDAGPTHITPGEVPDKHYPGGSTCRTTRPPGVDVRDAGMSEPCDPSAPGSQCCFSDADCVDGGANGRCEYGRFVNPYCTYDECTTTEDCGAGTGCACGDLTPSSANACVEAKCRVDDDCGLGGFCSPSPYLFNCGVPYYEGLYCHTAQDTCYNDSDCPQSDSGPKVRCSFRSEQGFWACGQEGCAG